MASPTTDLRETVENVLKAEFAAEGFPVKSGRLHPSVGANGPVAGVSPDAETGGNGSAAAATRVTVQVYDRWAKRVDPNAVVDPSRIEDWAWRFRTALSDKRASDGQRVWWFVLLDVTYPNDPTGQKTRFEAVVEARMPNETYA